MRLPSKESLTKRLAHVRAGLSHAFATASDAAPLSVDDVALIERVAGAIVQRRMAAPATVFLESMGPMNFLGSQALHFLTPIVECAFDALEVERVAHLLERRDTIARLITTIEAKSAR